MNTTDAPELPALDFETIKTMAQLARDLYVSIIDDPYYTAPSNPTWWIKYMKAASAAHVPEPPALDAAEIARQLRLVISVECSPGEYVHRIANQAADLLAAQAKRIAELQAILDRMAPVVGWSPVCAYSVEIAALHLKWRAESAEQRLADTQARLEKADALVRMLYNYFPTDGDDRKVVAYLNAARAKAKEPTDGK